VPIVSRLVPEPSQRVMGALARRIGALDAEPRLDLEWLRDVGVVGGRGVSRIAHFVAVMSRWTDAVVEIEAGPGAVIEPAAADALACGSRLLAEIERSEPKLVTGPIDGSMQQWTPIGRSAFTGEPPSQKFFVAPQAHQRAAVKPNDAGLYTSTVCVGGVSMWRAFLGPGGSAVRPLPRYTWNLTQSEPVVVAEITSAARWAEFVCAYPRRVGRVIYPDWATVSRSFDAVHITLPAIVAAQGFALTTGEGTIAPAFWDVETTFWVRWRFSAAQLVEGTKPAPTTARTRRREPPDRQWRRT
jgi:hypothetical protein